MRSSLEGGDMKHTTRRLHVKRQWAIERRMNVQIRCQRWCYTWE